MNNAIANPFNGIPKWGRGALSTNPLKWIISSEQIKIKA